MKIVRSPVRVTSGITVDQDIDFLTQYQVKQLASPASGESLRKGNKDIGNAELADAAAIAYPKLNITGAVKAADIEDGAGIPLTKLEAGVCSKTETDNKIIAHVGVSDAHHAQSAFVELLGAEDYQVTNDSTWEDWDLSAIIGVGAKAILLFIKSGTSGGVTSQGARKNGSALQRKFAMGDNTDWFLIAEVDANRVVELWDYANNTKSEFSVAGYWV